VKFRILEIGRIARTKGGPNRERLQQGYEKLCLRWGAWWDRPSDFPTRLPKGEAFSGRDGASRPQRTATRTGHHRAASAASDPAGQTADLRRRYPRRREMVSIFEPTTEIIRKGKAASRRSLARWSRSRKARIRLSRLCRIREAPSDSELVIAALDAHEKKLGLHSAPGGRRCRVLLGQERSCGA